MTENMQVYDVQSRKALVVRCCLNALKHTSGQDSFMRYLQKVNSEWLMKEISKNLSKDQITEELRGVVSIYIYGTAQYMMVWLLSDMKMTPEEVADIWGKAIPETLRLCLYD